MDSSPSHRVVVTGLGAVASLGHTVEAFWSSLLAGRSGIDRVTHFDPAQFASQIGAGTDDKEDALMVKDVVLALAGAGRSPSPPHPGAGATTLPIKGRERR